VKSAKNSVLSVVLSFLLLSTAIPVLMANEVNAENVTGSNGPVSYTQDGAWWKIQDDLITVLFPSNGKPMFLWWYSNDTSNVYVVKYKGLIEYMTLDTPYYDQKYEANATIVQDQMMAMYGMYGNMMQRGMIRERIASAYAKWLLDFHPSFLPFAAAKWDLTGPVEVVREDGVSYLSFNFTLVSAPPVFSFAEGNVIIRCRFYLTKSTENVYGLYDYSVAPGELKMDLVIKDWSWNIDKLDTFFDQLQSDYGISAPKMRAGLALWTDMASINASDLSIAQNDANSVLAEVPASSALAPSEPVELNSDTSDVIAAGQRIHMESQIASDTSPLNLGNRYNNFRLQFAEGSKTLAGFFDFVNTAVVIDPVTMEKSTVNVTAAYLAAGNHLRLFIGYPYFGASTLEHDPSIGVQGVAAWLPVTLLFLLIVATGIIAIAVGAVRLRKKAVNVMDIA
jgi:hypothetical protein